MALIFHPRIQQDLTEILEYYESEAGPQLADQFYASFIGSAQKAHRLPEHYHPINSVLRRANLKNCPYHFLYKITPSGIRVLVLKHDKRYPSYGLRRK
ncbi:MAG: type II toxin-antitoxin system RelE/ParE family toxin [Rubritalea sp.]|uniref:type II toxin-antitoxin system RelE/ParE family toxin n=1 Tax=Rubritalea sp. TaxID=2109375 RepID=UPI003242404E